MAVACGFYGGWSVVAAQLMDVESRLTEEERTTIRRAFASFTNEFPQLFFMMYLGGLPPPASPRQFSFWLLNHAAVQEAELLPNERGLVLVVDPTAGSAVLASGYFLENFLTQMELDTVLRAATKDLGRADYPGAVLAVTGALAALLKKKAREAARNPAAFAPPPAAAGAFPRLTRTGEPVMSDAEILATPTESSTNDPAAPLVEKPARRLRSSIKRNLPRRS